MGGLLASRQTAPPARTQQPEADRPGHCQLAEHVEIGQLCAKTLPMAPPPKSAEVEDSQSGAVDLHLELYWSCA